VGKGRGSFVTTTTTNGRSWGCRNVGIERPLLERFEVRKLEARTFPWSLRAIVEWSHPCGAGHEDRKVRRTTRLGICVLGEVEVSLEGLVARELAPVGCLGSARAWAAPDVGEEALCGAVLHAHVRVLEGPQARADPAVLTCGLVLVRSFIRLDFARVVRRMCWPSPLVGRKHDRILPCAFVCAHHIRWAHVAAYLIILAPGPALYLCQPLHELQCAGNASVQLDDKGLQLTWHDDAALQYSCGTREGPDQRGYLVELVFRGHDVDYANVIMSWPVVPLGIPRSAANCET